MAELSSTERKKISDDYGRILSEIREMLGLTKAELRAAVDATDIHIEKNQASYNTDLPQPARTVLTEKQKIRLFIAVLQRRFEVK